MMHSFHKTHLKNIEKLFEEKTGAVLRARKPARRPLRVAAVLAAILCCLTMTAFAISRFSSLTGDALGLSAVYEGEGIVTVQVENKSDKTLEFQPTLKLMRWATGEEIAPRAGKVSFRGTRIPAHTTGAMTLDLSAAYDMALLETPPAHHDRYYLVLTNHRFLFGQDWMCSVDFAKPAQTAKEPPAPDVPADADAPADAALAASIPAELRPYFETYTADPAENARQSEAYLALCRRLLEQVEGNVVPAVSPTELTVKDPEQPVVFDRSVPFGMQLQLTGLHRRSTDGYGKKIAASDTESALVLGAYIPQHQGEIDGGAEIPLLYIFTYPVSDIESPQDYAFVRGRLMTFAQMEPYKIYEDAQYVCYDMSDLFYSDLRQYVENMVSLRGDAYFDEQVWKRVHKIYSYYTVNLGALLHRRDS